MSNRPVLSVSFKLGETTHSVLSVWPGNKYAGTYTVSRDKGTDQYPTISLIDVIKHFARGEGFVNVRVPSQSDNRGGGSSRAPRDEPTPDARDFGDDLPF